MKKYWEQFRKLRGSFLLTVLALYFLVPRVLSATLGPFLTEEQRAKLLAFVVEPLCVVIFIDNLLYDLKKTRHKPIVIVLDFFCLLLLLLQWGLILYFGFLYGFDQ